MTVVNTRSFSSEKANKSSLAYTNACYRKALKDLDLEAAEVDETNKVAVGKRYIFLIRTLPEWMLTEIIEEHENGIQNRDESTIQEILDELALRIILRDQHDKNVSNNA